MKLAATIFNQIPISIATEPGFEYLEPLLDRFSGVMPVPNVLTQIEQHLASHKPSPWKVKTNGTTVKVYLETQ